METATQSAPVAQTLSERKNRRFLTKREQISPKRRHNSRISLVCISVVLLLLLSACGTGSKSASDQTIKNDLLNALSEGIEPKEDGYSRMAQLSPLYVYEYADFEIEKRQTALEDRTDKVYVNASFTSTDGVIQYTGSFVLDYALYNEGWLLEEISVNSFDFRALQDAEFTTEEIASALANHGYENATDIQVVDRSVMLEYNEISYDVTATCTYTYVTEKINVRLYFCFREDGWSIQNVDSVTELAEPEMDWHIDGYFVEFDSGTGAFYISADGPIETLSIHYYYDYSSDNGYQLSFSDQSFYQIPYSSIKEIMSNLEYKYIMNYNFSVKLRGSVTDTSFYEYKYVADSGSSMFFIGRDKLGRVYYYDEDEYNRRILVDTCELVPTD